MNKRSLARIAVMLLLGFVGYMILGKSLSVSAPDYTNPSQLSQSNYANGKKRAADAAQRVLPHLKTELASKGLLVGSPVFIRAFKESRELEVWVYNKTTKKYQEFKNYKIHGMSGQLGPKLKEGDRQAVEGFYKVWKSSLNPQSRFHLSFNLGYPNKYDKAHKRTGSALMIHGNSVSVGCLAMTDVKIEEIYTLCAEALNNGQGAVQVHCFPFRMTEENMQRMQTSQWYSFWQNLKTGYDLFETNKVPSTVSVKGKSYAFK